jgi:hypothetical protein
MDRRDAEVEELIQMLRLRQDHHYCTRPQHSHRLHVLVVHTYRTLVLYQDRSETSAVSNLLPEAYGLALTDRSGLFRHDQISGMVN